MAFKLVLISAILAAANAGIVSPLGYAAAPVGYAAAPSYNYGAIGSQTQSVLRSADGNSAISTYSKAVDTAYSSVRKYDTRVSNDAIVKVASPVAYAAAPAYTSYAAPAVASYAAPALGYASPLAARVAAPLGYASPLAARVAAPLGYASPYGAARVAAPIGVANAGLLGVAYSAAPAVAHISYSTPTLSYAY